MDRGHNWTDHFVPPEEGAQPRNVKWRLPWQPEWMQGFGKLKRLREETGRIQAVIDQEFEVIEPEDSR